MIPESSKELLQPALWAEAPAFIPKDTQGSHDLFRVVPKDGQGLFTGYFEPVLKGSYTREGPFQYPLYRTPADLVATDNFAGSSQPGLRAYGRIEEGNLTPYFSRAEIEAGALKGKNLELIYLASPVDVFFLHVQGSGKIELPDGSSIRARFAGKNGHPYTAISAILKQEENLAAVTMEVIREFLIAYPAKAQGLMNRNASYIFFDLSPGAGPIGASGAILEAQKSLAIDDTIWPYGLDVIVQTKHPLEPKKPLILRMKTHDCGSAIRGAARGDIFFGSGLEAGKLAGAMNAPGTLWIILPRM